MHLRTRDTLAKLAVFCLAGLPFVDGLWRIRSGERLGGNPIETLEHLSGEWAMYCLLATLAITPLRQLLNWRWPLKVRRMLGLYSAFYVAVHIACYLWLDLDFAWGDVWRELTGRPTITVGGVAAIGMLVLAVTSPREVVRKLGRRWSLVHRSVYAVAVLAVVHVAWKGKDGGEQALLFGALLIVLLLPRFVAVAKS